MNWNENVDVQHDFYDDVSEYYNDMIMQSSDAQVMYQHPRHTYQSRTTPLVLVTYHYHYHYHYQYHELSCPYPHDGVDWLMNVRTRERGCYVNCCLMCDTCKNESGERERETRDGNDKGRRRKRWGWLRRSIRGRGVKKNDSTSSTLKDKKYACTFFRMRRTCIHTLQMYIHMAHKN